MHPMLLAWFVGLVLLVLGLMIDPSEGADMWRRLAAWFSRTTAERTPQARVALRWLFKSALFLGIVFTPGSGLVMMYIGIRNLWRYSVADEQANDRIRECQQNAARQAALEDAVSSERGTDDPTP